MGGVVITLSSGDQIDRCEERLKRFVSHDAYELYDFWGGCRQQPADTLDRDHVYAMNAAMRARSSTKSWDELTGGYSNGFPQSLLVQIPSDLDLLDSADEEVRYGNAVLSQIVREVAKKKWLTDMAATKSLHLLRPRFVAISDSFVRALLGVSGPSPEFLSGNEKAEACAKRMLAVQKAMRSVGQQNSEALDSLQAYVTSAMPGVPPRTKQCRALGISRVPVCLSKLRVLDIMLWTEAMIKLDSTWRSWYSELR